MKVNGFSRVVRLSLCITATLLALNPVAAQQEHAPGVTDTEIRIGQTMPYSGPASAWGTVGLPTSKWSTIGEVLEVERLR
jgi:hypothetical protein